jgi:hypothetical protein
MNTLHPKATLAEKDEHRTSRQRDMWLDLLMLFSILGLSLGGALLLVLLGR